MTKQELLKPRYEVIADYPKSHFQIGDLIKMKEIYPYSGYSYELQGGDIAAPEYFDQYPHLFKPLSWWQHRELKDMPEYVKVVNPHYTWELPKGCVRKVAEWKFNDNNNLLSLSGKLENPRLQAKTSVPVV